MDELVNNKAADIQAPCINRVIKSHTTDYVGEMDFLPSMTQDFNDLHHLYMLGKKNNNKKMYAPRDEFSTTRVTSLWPNDIMY